MYFKLYSEPFWMLNIQKSPESSICLDDGYKQSKESAHKHYFETEIRATSFIGFKCFKLQCLIGVTNKGCVSYNQCPCGAD
jgi:hypothetical protein